MRKLLVGVAVLCLLVPAIARSDEYEMQATVVSVDVKTRSMTIKNMAFGEWQPERVATWNEKTKWKDETGGKGKSKSATADLATRLKSGSKVYVIAYNGVLTEVRALAPPDKVD